MHGAKQQVLCCQLLLQYLCVTGAVIMPWMIYYQQSAVVDKKLTVDDLKYSRIDTAIGMHAPTTQIGAGVVVIGIFVMRF